jgi:hypothetical protein
MDGDSQIVFAKHGNQRQLYEELRIVGMVASPVPSKL